MKYQIADLNNGPFGEVYTNLEDAEVALRFFVEEGQTINDGYSRECLDVGLEVPQAEEFYEIVELN